MSQVGLVRNKREKTQERTQKDECPLIPGLTPECMFLQAGRTFSKKRVIDSLLKYSGFHPSLGLANSTRGI